MRAPGLRRLLPEPYNTDLSNGGGTAPIAVINRQLRGIQSLRPFDTNLFYFVDGLPQASRVSDCDRKPADVQ
jgi:hypothetical protein